MKNDKSSALEVTTLVNDETKTALFSTIFSFHSNIGGIRGIFDQSLKSIFFPIAAALELITTLLIFLRFIKADNKNLGKTYDLVSSLITTSLVVTAIAGALFLGFSPLLISGLFIGAMAAGAVYHMGQFVYHAYRWLSTPSADKAQSAFFRYQTLKYAIASIIGLAIVAGIVTTMMLPMAAPIVLAIGGIATASILIAGGLYSLYRYFNPTPSHDTLPQKTRREERRAEQALNEDNMLRNQITNTKSTGFDYYHRIDRSQKLTGDPNQNRQFLLMEIYEKITSLEKQIHHAKGSIGNAVWSEEKKRSEKIEFLTNLAVSLLPIDKDQATKKLDDLKKLLGNPETFDEFTNKVLAQHSSINNLSANNIDPANSPISPEEYWTNDKFEKFLETLSVKKAFQSFFREKSDTKDIYEAVVNSFSISQEAANDQLDNPAPDISTSPPTAHH